MSIVWPVYAILSADADVLSYVGGSIVKIFRNIAPQDQSPPYVVWNTIAGSDNNYMSERPGIDNPLIQIDCYSRDETQVAALANSVQHALELHAHQRGVPRDTYEGEPVKLYRVSMDFSFWVNRVVGSP